MSGLKQFWRKTMTTLKSFAIATALLAGGTSLSIAQNVAQTPAPFHVTKEQCAGIRQGLVECHKIHMAANSNGTSKPAASAATPLHGSDTVILSDAQRRAVWNDLSKQATNQNAAGFDATTGTFVPNTVKIAPIPSEVTADNPSLRPYDFAMVDHKLVIVDPSNEVITNVLTK
jgi:hypothetical protein